MSDRVLLIGDIGGTNARFALANDRQPGYDQVAKFSCADYTTADDAITEYLQGVGVSEPDVICLAAAGPVVEQCVRFTNNHWQIRGPELKERFNTPAVRLVNDFEAIALSLPFLEQEDLEPVGLTRTAIGTDRDFDVGVLGPGTGLGVAGLLGHDGQIHPIVGEGGHRGFAPESRSQIEVLNQLRSRFERVSDERLLSGPGVENIDGALRKIHGRPGAARDAATIFALAEERQDEIAVEAVRLFFEALGQVAGNLALELGAFDGVFIAGGIVKRYPEMFRASGFRAGFENKGRHRPLMERVPTVLINHEDPGLLGAAYGALELLGRSGRQRRRRGRS